MPPKPLPIAVRAERYIDRAGECWLWTSKTDRHGYALLRGPGRGTPDIRVHRYMYEAHRGPIPVGLVLDHVVCETPRCVNPWHMEAVTQRDNVLRGAGPSAQNARKTHCVRGHEFTPENTRERVGRNGRAWRRCLVCRDADNVVVAATRKEARRHG